MAIVITPNKQERSTHHFGLTDGTNTIGLIVADARGNASIAGLQKNPYPRSSLKIYSGEQTHATLEPPFTPITQAEWLGGIGSQVFEADVTRYHEGWRADTTKAGMLLLGPRECYTTGIRATEQHWPHEDVGGGTIVYWWEPLKGTASKRAVKIIPSANITVKHIYFIARRHGAGQNTTIQVNFKTDNAGSPSTLITNGSADLPYNDYLNNRWGDRAGVDVRVSLATAITLTAAIPYWLEFTYTGAADDANHYEILCTALEGGTPPETKIAPAAGTPWTVDASIPYFRITEADTPFKAFFIEYKSALYLITRKDAGGAPKVYINGDQSVANKGANTHTTTRLYDVNKTWTTDQWKGCILRITGGTGLTNQTPYRTISGNGTNYLDVADAWEIAPDDTTEYCILGSNTWREIGMHGITLPPTDVLSVNNAVYIALGETPATTETDMMRMRAYPSGGAWTYHWDRETGTKANFLAAEPDVNGGTKIWKALLSTPKIASAPGVDCSGSGAAATLTFGADIVIGDTNDRITGLEVYGEPVPDVLWVFKEGSIYPRTGDNVFSRLPVRELAGIKDIQNGWAHLVHNLYLYFSTRSGWQRYYNSSLDNIGPDRDAGLPVERRGSIVSAVGMPGRYYVAMNAGGAGKTSSVLVNNGTGWSEVYRAPADALAIRRLYIQPLPGDAVERLWISQGADVLWVPIHLNPMQARTTGYHSYKFNYEAAIITGRMHANLQDVWKFYQSVKVQIANLTEITGGPVKVEIDYQIETDGKWPVGQWASIETPFNTSSSEWDFPGNLIGRWLRLRVRLLTEQSVVTPQVASIVVNGITRLPAKYTLTVPFRLGDHEPNLLGQPDTQLPDTVLAQIEAWAATPKPLTTMSTSRRFNGLRVFIENVPQRPVRVVTNEGREVDIAQLTLIGL